MEHKKVPLNTIIAIIAFVFMLVSIYFNFVIVQRAHIVARATQNESAEVSMCLNQGPNMTACTGFAPINITYICIIDPQDMDSNGHTYTANTTLFNITKINASHGYINFIPSLNDKGLYTVNISVNDNVGCDNSINSRLQNFLVADSHCIDGEKNSDEEGIDCGGSCPGFCTGPSTPTNTNTGSDSGSGTSISSGGGFGVPIPKEEIYFHVRPALVRISVQRGQNKSTSFTVSNPMSRVLNFTVSTNLKLPWVHLSHKAFQLYSRGTQDIVVSATPNTEVEPGVYFGKITITGYTKFGELSTTTIGIIIEVETTVQYFDLSLNIPGKYRVLAPGDNVKANVAVFSLGTIKEKEVNLIFQIIDSEGHIWAETASPLHLKDKAIFDKIMALPPDLPEGDYLFAAKVVYGESVGTSTELFTIKGPPQVIEETPSTILTTNYLPLLWVIILLLVIVLGFVIVRIKHKPVKQALPQNQQTPIETIRHQLELLEDGTASGFISEPTQAEETQKILRKTSFSHLEEVTKKDKASLSSLRHRDQNRELTPLGGESEPILEDEKQNLMASIKDELDAMEHQGIPVEAERKLLATLMKGGESGKKRGRHRIRSSPTNKKKSRRKENSIRRQTGARKKKKHRT